MMVYSRADLRAFAPHAAYLLREEFRRLLQLRCAALARRRGGGALRGTHRLERCSERRGRRGERRDRSAFVEPSEQDRERTRCRRQMYEGERVKL